MEIGSAGAGSVAQIVPTQTGSQQEITQAQSRQQVEQSPPQETQKPSPPPANERVGTVVDVEV